MSLIIATPATGRLKAKKLLATLLKVKRDRKVGQELLSVTHYYWLIHYIEQNSENNDRPSAINKHF